MAQNINTNQKINIYTKHSYNLQIANKKVS